MTDPNDITQASGVVDSAGGPGGIVGAALGALTVLGGLWRTVFGTKAERVAADAQEDDALKHAAGIALRQAERAEADTKSMRVERDLAYDERDDCKESLRKMNTRVGDVEDLHHACDERSKKQAGQIEWMSRALDAVVAGEPLPERPASMTPPKMPHPNEVRAALAAQEDTGP